MLTEADLEQLAPYTVIGPNWKTKKPFTYTKHLMVSGMESMQLRDLIL